MKTALKSWIGMATGLALMIAMSTSATAAADTFTDLQGSMTEADTGVTISGPGQNKAHPAFHTGHIIVTQIIPSHPTPDDEIVLKVQGTANNRCGVPEGVSVSVNGDEIHVSKFFSSHRVDEAILCSQAFVSWTRFAFVGRLSQGFYEVMARGDLDSEPLSFTVEPAGIGGEIRALSARHVLCHNLTTGQRVQIDMEVEDIRWDCEKMGLEVKPGDEIEQTILGIARLNCWDCEKKGAGG